MIRWVSGYSNSKKKIEKSRKIVSLLPRFVALPKNVLSFISLLLLGVFLSGSISIVAQAQPVLLADNASSNAVGINAHAEDVLWDQTANRADLCIDSQNFTDPGGGFDSFDSRAADDFMTPISVIWIVNAVRAIGVFNTGPFQSFNVSFFNDNGGTPGAVIHKCVYLNLSANDPVNPDATISLPTPCVLDPDTAYWVSVQANMPFIPNGEWFWCTESVQTLSVFYWENPGNGFGTGCTTFMPLPTCIDDSRFGPDLSFQLLGEEFESRNVPVPTLSEWGLVVMAGILGIVGFMVIRRRKVSA
jgi:hypothetical protein